MRKRTNKNSKLKIEFHKSYLLVAFGFILTGYYLNLIVFTILILVHEFGHDITAKIFHFNVEKIIIYPYGGITKIKDRIDRDINEELLIATSGIILQSFFYFIIIFLNHHHLIRDYTMNLFTLYHQQMVFFNLLPIYPLDGSKIFNLLLNKFFCYNLSNQLTILISFFTIIFIIITNIYHYNYSNIMIFMILITYLWDFFKKRKYLYNRFLLEKYLYQNEYQKIKNIYNIKKMFKNKKHILYINQILIPEEIYLQKKFQFLNSKISTTKNKK